MSRARKPHSPDRKASPRRCALAPASAKRRKKSLEWRYGRAVHALRLIANTKDNPEGWATDAQIAEHYLREIGKP